MAPGLPFPSPVPQFPCCKKRAVQLGATFWGGSGEEMLVAVQDRAGAVGLLDLSTPSTSDALPSATFEVLKGALTGCKEAGCWLLAS